MFTIAAIATPLGVGAISIIKISGDEAISIASKVFSPKDGSDLKSKGKYTATLGTVCDNGEYVDTCIALVFLAPNSYTGEDVVEISCHGGVIVTKKILRIILSNGAVIASPGEFTKRAYINGKMSLTQAEAVIDVINAHSDVALRVANSQVNGALSNAISEIRSDLLEIAAEFAANMDYPDDDIPIDLKKPLGILINAQKRLYKLCDNFDRGMLIKNGIVTVIVGKPNVGKSSLMNLLARCKRSIVTEVAGTTRDVIEESILVGEVTLRLCDTAGIRHTDDIIEGIGVELSIERLNSAELILAVFDGSNNLDNDDKELIEKISNKPCIAIINKNDLPVNIDLDYIKSKFKTIMVSCLDEDSIEIISNAIEELFEIYDFDTTAPIIFNERQRLCCVNALERVDAAIAHINSGGTLDILVMLMENAIEEILKLSGERTTEVLVDTIFSNFCVGK